MSWNIRKLATNVAEKAVSSLEGAGVFAVELFLTRDNQVGYIVLIHSDHQNGLVSVSRLPNKYSET